MTQELFFVIEITRKDRTRGFVIEKADDIYVSAEPIADMAQFESYYSAREFIKKHHLERNGAKASIVSNQELIQSRGDYTKIINAPMVYYTAINGIGQKIFYDTVQEGYYFKDGEVGYCVWKDEDSMNDFIKKMELPEDVTCKRLVQGLTTDQEN